MDQRSILKSPLISEKSLLSAQFNKYTFVVERKANKKEIAAAVKNIFGVDVISVRTSIIKGRTKKALKTRQTIKTMPYKKAIVEIKQGQKIDLFDTGTSEGEKK
jgi:large subunit ribosomal protein L23